MAFDHVRVTSVGTWVCGRVVQTLDGEDAGYDLGSGSNFRIWASRTQKLDENDANMQTCFLFLFVFNATFKYTVQNRCEILGEAPLSKRRSDS